MEGVFLPVQPSRSPLSSFLPKFGVPSSGSGATQAAPLPTLGPGEPDGADRAAAQSPTHPRV